MTMYRITTIWEDEKGMVVEGVIREEHSPSGLITTIAGVWVKAKNQFLEGKLTFRCLVSYKKLTAYQEARERAAYNKRHIFANGRIR